MQQILFDGQVFVGLQARKTSIEFYLKFVEITKEVIKANVYKIYYQLVVGQKQIGSIDANINNYEKLLHLEPFYDQFIIKLYLCRYLVVLS